MPEYQDLFEQRGSSYDRAMQAFPDARAAEFEQLLAPIDIHPGMTIGDVPAGGGYLRSYLPPGVEWVRHEPCADFQTHAGQGSPDRPSVPLLPLPWGGGTIDALVSLAGVHHLSDKRPFYAEAARVTANGGQFVLSDVADGHPVAAFLDEFVGAHNSTGHDGVYLDDRTLGDLRDTGWNLREDRLNAYHWTFVDRSAMAAFTTALFDIRGLGAEDVADAIESRLGVDERADGTVGMRWALRTILLTKN